MEFLHRVLGIAVTDNTGRRIFSKYYTCNKTLSMEKNKSRITAKIMELRDVNLQKTLENRVHVFLTNSKYHSSAVPNSEILLVDGFVLTFQQVADVTFTVIGDSDDNEEVLLGVLKVLIESLRTILNVPELNRRQLLLKYDALVLTVDELIEDGVILETDVNKLVAEVTPFTADTNIETAHKTFATVNKYLRENL